MTVFICIRCVAAAAAVAVAAGVNIVTHEEVAIKLESVKTRHPQLAYEYKLYRILAGGGTLHPRERGASHIGARCLSFFIYLILYHFIR